MTKQHINIGQSANDKAGDPLRTAFSKVNENFDELYNHVSAGVVAGNTAPTDPGEGDLWWDSESGRIYVYYGSTWVDASPVDGAGISSTNELVNGDSSFNMSSDGTLTLAHPAEPNYHPLSTTLTIQKAAGNYHTISGAYGLSLQATPVPSGYGLNTNTNFVDIFHDGVSVNVNDNTWGFGTDGKITFPGANGFQATFGSVEPIGDVLHSINDLVLKSDLSVTIVSGEGIDALETSYNDQLTDLTSLLSAEIYGTSFLPASHDSIIALAAAKAVNPLISDQIITVAIAVSDAWDAWQAALNLSAFTIGVGNLGWYFNSDGKLTLPAGGDIVDSNGDTVLGGGGGTIWTNDANGCLRAELSATGFEAFTEESHIDLQNSGIWSIGSYGNSTFIGNNEFANLNDLSLRSGDATFITTNLRENGNYQWKFGTDGALTLPDDSVIASYKPVTVIAQTTTAQTITDSASAAFIQFVETVDTASAYSTGTFTAPYTGYYQVNMSIYFSTTVTLNSGSFLLIDTNLDNTKQVTIINGSWSGSYLHYSTVIPATAGDAIRVAFRQVSGADIDVASGSRLTIHRVSIS